MIIKKLQLICIGLISSCILNAQAPVAGFSLSNTPCINQAFTPINTTTGATVITYSWSTFPTTSTILPTASAANPTITISPGGNYTLTLVATNTVGTSTYNMAINNLTTCPVCLDTIRMIKNIDTLTTYAANNNTLILGCQSGFAGFLTGTNCYKDKEFAQYYPPSSYSNTPLPQVNSVIVLFDSLGTKAGSSSAAQIYCKLYGGTVGYGPNSIIATSAANLSTIAGSTNKTVTIQYCGTPTYTFTTTKIIPYMFNFGPAVIPASGFFASVQTPYSSVLDSIRIFSNTNTNLSNDSSSWVLQYTNNWRTLRHAKNAKLQLGILPIISCSPVSGIEEHKSVFGANVNIMPNPSNGKISLIFTLANPQNISVKIFNSYGQEISSNQLENVTNNLIDIDLSEHQPGIYFIEITNGNERVLKKTIVIK